MNVIKDFIDIFYFEEMLHGRGVNHLISSKHPYNTRHFDVAATRRTIISPINSPITSPLRDSKSSVPMNTREMAVVNRLFLSVILEFFCQSITTVKLGLNYDF